MRYTYSPETILPPGEVRKCLSIAFAGEKRFAMGAMDDSTEALEAVLCMHHAEQVCAVNRV